MKKINLILIFAAAIAVLTSCGSKYEIDEIRAITKDLVERSAEMNVIYFGEGLPTIDEEGEGVDEFIDSFGHNVKTVNYLPVSEESPYQNETELREATLEVFTEKYAEILFVRAFNGISHTIEYQNDSSLNENVSVVYARYIEKDGVLTVRLDLEDEAMKLGRVYDYENLKIVRESGNNVTVEIPTEFEGRELDIELTIVKTDGGWRLDTPTY
ncbi:MAG: hypothetical protein E7672_04560 [Ruminococcaceae bacterium]|nr:hypothetical protein [Oscillospiraceae bacterium]